MEEKTLDISKEALNNLSIEELAELKVEVEELIIELDRIIETCNETLNS